MQQTVRLYVTTYKAVHLDTKDCINVLAMPLHATYFQGLEGFSADSGSVVSGGAMKPVLVVMLGGCTFAEMTSLKAAMMKKHNIKPIILTTDILTGDRFIGSFIPASAKLAISDAQATMATL